MAAIPKTMERYSIALPISVPNRFIPKSLAGSFARLNVTLKIQAANGIGKAKKSDEHIIRGVISRPAKTEIGTK